MNLNRKSHNPIETLLLTKSYHLKSYGINCVKDLKAIESLLKKRFLLDIRNKLETTKTPFPSMLSDTITTYESHRLPWYNLGKLWDLVSIWRFSAGLFEFQPGSDENLACWMKCRTDCQIKKFPPILKLSRVLRWIILLSIFLWSLGTINFHHELNLFHQWDNLWQIWVKFHEIALSC